MDFIHITFVDIIDIMGFALILFYVNKLTRGTNAPNILLGILIIYMLWLGARGLNMELLSAVLGNIIGVGVIALIVIFQPELRKFLHIIGTSGKRGQETILGRIFETGSEEGEDVTTIKSVVEACKQMSHSKTGALMVIQRKSDLRIYAETGVPINAQPSVPLILSIFFKNSPLHDGAMIIKESRIYAAKCLLPSTKSEQPINFGMRHRAAIGISEESDAMVVVVSEETGSISVVSEGKIKTEMSVYDLRTELMSVLESN